MSMQRRLRHFEFRDGAEARDMCDNRNLGTGLGAVMTGSSGHFRTAAVVARANMSSSTRISCVE